jgi:hypothetical protein
MRFGDPTEFAIDAFHEPAGPEWAGFGRMCIYVESVALGDLSDKHCSLFHVVERFREISTSAEALWDDSFTGLSDPQVFAVLDDALFIGSEPQWERYGRFDFLTNTGEQFDGFKTFIVCSPARQVHVLWQSRDGSFGSGVCSSAAFRGVAEAFVVWFDEQVGPSRQPPNQSLEPTAGRTIDPL